MFAFAECVQISIRLTLYVGCCQHCCLLLRIPRASEAMVQEALYQDDQRSAREADAEGGEEGWPTRARLL